MPPDLQCCLPMPLVRVDTRASLVTVRSILGGQFDERSDASQPRPGDVAGRRQNSGLLRQRSPLRHAKPHGASAMNEHDYEPIPGLPAPLPPGETILWQGSPNWEILARRALRVRMVGMYFVILIAWGISGNISAGTPAIDIGAVRPPTECARYGGTGPACVVRLAGRPDHDLHHHDPSGGHAFWHRPADNDPDRIPND